MKKKTKAELLELRSQIAERRSAIMRKIEAEGTDGKPRDLTDEEVAELEKLRNDQALTQAQIDEKELEEAQQAEKHRQEDEERKRTPEVKVTERMCANPLTQLIRGALSGNIPEEVRGISEEGRKRHASANLGVNNRGVYVPMESRANLQATVATKGQEGVDTDLFNILDPIREQLVAAKAGAQILTGLTSNVELPAYSGTTAKWETEIAKAKDGAGTFSTKKLAPKRLATTINISRQLLLQDSAGIEAMLRRDIIAAIYTKLESTMFGKGAATDGAPAGLLNGLSNAGAVKDYASLVDLYVKLRKALVWGGNIKAIVNPDGKGILAKTQVQDGVPYGFLANGDKLVTGQDLLETTALEDGILTGDFSQLILGQWGALEFKVDDTTRFDEGLVRIMVNSYWDYRFRDDSAYLWATIGAGAGIGG